MAKFLKDSEYASLKQGADNYQVVVSAILALNTELKEEEVTSDVILEMLADKGEDSAIATQLATIKETLSTTQSTLELSQERVKELETENKNLTGSPAEDSAVVTSDTDPNAKPQTIADFADKNTGDTVAILGQAEKEGLI